MHVHIKRIYEPLLPEDGYRVLVDRLWPRGLARRLLGLTYGYETWRLRLL